MPISGRFSEQAWVTLVEATGCQEAAWVRWTFADWEFPLEIVEADSLPPEHPWFRFRSNSALVGIDALWETVVWTAGESIVAGQATDKGKCYALEWLLCRRWEYVSFLVDHVGSERTGLPWQVVLSRRVWEGQSPKLFAVAPGTNWFDATAPGLMMSIEPEPKVLFAEGAGEFPVDILRDWTRQHLETLVSLWTWELDSVDACERLRPEKPAMAPPDDPAVFCCDVMEREIASHRGVHGAAYGRGGGAITFGGTRGIFEFRDSSPGGLKPIAFCPWCGTRLPRARVDAP